MLANVADTPRSGAFAGPAAGLDSFGDETVVVKGTCLREVRERAADTSSRLLV